jgi:hypothetical protein
VSLRTAAPRPDNRTYGFIQGGGVASALLFGLLYVSDRYQAFRGSRERSTASTAAGAGDRSEDDESGTGR